MSTVNAPVAPASCAVDEDVVGAGDQVARRQHAGVPIVGVVVARDLGAAAAVRACRSRCRSVVPWVVTKTSLRSVSTSLNTDSGARSPPHEPWSADAPDVVPVKRPPGSITDTAPVSHSGLLQTAPSPVASGSVGRWDRCRARRPGRGDVGRDVGARSGATSGGEIASGPTVVAARAAALAGAAEPSAGRPPWPPWSPPP